MLTDPWCARASTGAAPRVAPACAITWAGGDAPGGGGAVPDRSAWISLSRAVRRSASRRELAKTKVERWASMRSTMRASTWGQIEVLGVASGPTVATRSAMSSTGTWMVRSHSFGDSARTISTDSSPARKRAASSAGCTVADSPIRGTGRPARWSRRARLTARWAPRFDPAIAWTSSMITDSTSARMLRACEVSSRNNDSGVVMRMSGGRRTIAWRSADGVSPVRTPTVTRGSARPMRPACAAMPASGARRLRSTSTARALSGLT